MRGIMAYCNPTITCVYGTNMAIWQVYAGLGVKGLGALKLVLRDSGPTMPIFGSPKGSRWPNPLFS